MWPRVALTACARSSLESIRVPSRSKINRSISIKLAHPLERGLRCFSFLACARFTANRFAPRLARDKMIIGHFALQRVAMNPEQLAGRRTVPSRALQGLLDQGPLQQFHHFFEKKPVAHQVVHQSFKFLFHCPAFSAYGNSRIPLFSALRQIVFTCS